MPLTTAFSLVGWGWSHWFDSTSQLTAVTLDDLLWPLVVIWFKPGWKKTCLSRGSGINVLFIWVLLWQFHWPYQYCFHLLKSKLSFFGYITIPLSLTLLPQSKCCLFLLQSCSQIKRTFAIILVDKKRKALKQISLRSCLVLSPYWYFVTCDKEIAWLTTLMLKQDLTFNCSVGCSSFTLWN